MATSFINKYKNTFIHIAFWLVYASFFLYQISFSRGGHDPNWNRILKDFSFHIFGMLVICYLNYLVFFPRFLKRRQLGRYLLEFLPVFIIFSYLLILGKQYVIDGFQHEVRWVYSTRFIVVVTFNTFFLVAFVSILKFVEDWFDLEAAKKQLENDRLVSELRFLKAQINPHFLFNTLNNLYYLAFTNSPNTTEVIAKLSQMMRYMIHESNHEKVLLTREIEYLKNYISLEKLRLEDNIPIDLEIEGNIETVTIAPLILITFLENAFKHGVSSSQKDAWIKIKLNVKHNTLIFQVTNSKITNTGKTVSEKSGIGLQNVKRRLELTYPSRYELTVKDENDSYNVSLAITL